MKKSKNCVIDGVCAGLAEHLTIDPLWVRLLFVLGGFVGIYILCIFLMDEPNENS